MLKEQIQVKFSFPPMSHFEDQKYIEFYGASFSKLIQRNKDGNFELNQRISKGHYFFETEGFTSDSSSIYLNKDLTLIIKEKNRSILQECLDKKGGEENKNLRKIETKANNFFLNFDYSESSPEFFWEKLDLLFQQINRTLSFSNLNENFLKIQREDLQYLKAHLAFIYLENYGIRFEWNEEIQDFKEKIIKQFTISEKEKLESFINEKLKTEEEEIFFLGNHYKNFLETRFNLIANEINDYDFINHINKVDKLFEFQLIKDYYFFHITRKYFLEHANDYDLIRSNFAFYKQKNKNICFEKHISSLYKKIFKDI